MKAFLVGTFIYLQSLTSISGVEFEQAYANRTIVILEGLEVPVISLVDLIINKRASARPQDLVDVEKLAAVQKDGR